MTLTQSERGYPAPIQHIGVPNTVLEEKGKVPTEGVTWHNDGHMGQITLKKFNQSGSLLYVEKVYKG